MILRLILPSILLLIVQSTDPGLASSSSQPAGTDVFKGYSCKTNADCMSRGVCIATNFGSSLCNCTESWLGPTCQILARKLEPELSVSFKNCLNVTGSTKNVDAGSVYVRCGGGNVECWLEEGRTDAIKVFFSCLNTDYSLLIREEKHSRPPQDDVSRFISSSNASTMLGFKVVSPVLNIGDEIIVFATPKKQVNPTDDEWIN